MRDDKGLGLGVSGDTYPLPVLLGRLAPVSISKASIALVQQVTHQLGQKRLKKGGQGKKEGKGDVKNNGKVI